MKNHHSGTVHHISLSYPFFHPQHHIWTQDFKENEILHPGSFFAWESKDDE